VLVQAALGAALSAPASGETPGVAHAGLPVPVSVPTPVAATTEQVGSRVSSASSVIRGTTEAAAVATNEATASVAAAAAPVADVTATATETVQHVSQSLPSASQVAGDALTTRERVASRPVATPPPAQRPTAPPVTAPVASNRAQPIASWPSGRTAQAHSPAPRRKAWPATRTSVSHPARLDGVLVTAPVPSAGNVGRQPVGSRPAARSVRHHTPPLPGPTTGPGVGTVPGQPGGGGLFAALLLGFVLAVPYAGRWLRPRRLTGSRR
jgi:hypothetical protein